MRIMGNIWSSLLRSEVGRRTSKELTTSLRGVRTLGNPLLLRRGFSVVLLVLALFALSPITRAVTPAPDGGYANGNTVKGDGALQSLTTGVHNTASGYQALFSITSPDNTANGYQALLNNTNGVQNTSNGASKQLKVQVAGRACLYYNYGIDNSYTNLQSAKKGEKPRFM